MKAELCGDILKALDKWDKTIFDAVWFGYSALADECGNKYSIKELKKGMKVLNAKKKVTLKPTYDGDGKICGSGWFLTATSKKY